MRIRLLGFVLLLALLAITAFGQQKARPGPDVQDPAAPPGDASAPPSPRSAPPDPVPGSPSAALAAPSQAGAQRPAPPSQAQHLGAFAPALHFLDGARGWVVLREGAADTLWHTDDGGRTWDRLATLDFQVDQLVFVDGSRGWAAGRTPACEDRGAPECVLMVAGSSDGGRSWQRLWSRPARAGAWYPPVRATLSVLGPTIVAWFAQQDETALAISNDGGATWHEPAPPEPGTTFDAAAAAGSGRIAALTRRCRGWDDCPYAMYLRTNDGPWVRQAELSRVQHHGHGSISFADGQHGWLLLGGETGYCGSSGCRGPLFHTGDGGGTWQRLEWQEQYTGAEQGGPGFPQVIRFTTTRQGWMLVGSGASNGLGGIGVTRDGGATWVRHVPFGLRDYTALSAPDAQTAWALGRWPDAPDRPVLVHTASGGATWRPVPLPAPPFVPPAGLRTFGFHNTRGQTAWGAPDPARAAAWDLAQALRLLTDALATARGPATLLASPDALLSHALGLTPAGQGPGSNWVLAELTEPRLVEAGATSYWIRRLVLSLGRPPRLYIQAPGDERWLALETRALPEAWADWFAARWESLPPQ